MFGKSGVRRCSNFLPPRTTGSQEQRFTILKEIVLQGRKAPRFANFTNTLYKHLFGNRKRLYCTIFAQIKKNIAGASNMVNKFLSETRNKSHVQNVNLRNEKLGKYQ